MHTAQIFNFEPSDQLDLPLRIRVEVPTEPGKTKRLYTAVCPTEVWDRRPKVTVEYFALKAYEWSTPAAFEIVRPALQAIAHAVDTYSEELFPLADLVTYPGIREIEVSSSDEPDSPEGCDAQCWNGSYHSTLLQASSADVVVAFLPHRINSGGNTEGTLRAGRATIIFAAGTNADNFSRYVNGVVHEIGHALTLPHLPLIADDKERARLVALRDAGAPFWFKGIEGYRLNPTGTTGWNKSSVEGNEEDEILVPLMFPGTMHRRRAFISHHHYLQIQRLFDDIGD